MNVRLVSKPELLVCPKKKNMPIFLAMSYLWLTFILTPLVRIPGTDFQIRTPFLLIGFITLAFSALFLGYITGENQIFKTKLFACTPDAKKIKFIKIILLLGCLHLILSGYLIQQASPLGLQESFQDPGRAYQEYRRSINEIDTQVISQTVRLLTLTNILPLAAMPLGTLAWRFLDWRWRSLYIIGIFFYIIIAIQTGTNKGIGDVMIAICAALAIKANGNWKSQRAIIRRKTRNYKFLAIGVAIFFLVWFSFNLHARNKAYGVDTSHHEDTFVGSIFGSATSEAFSHLIFYSSGGYIGLSQSLQMPFEWTYGVGNSRAAMGYLEQYSGIDVLSHHYMYRAEATFGWPMDMYWSTIFPWLASDITFLGCIIFMFILGRLFVRCWFESAIECRLSSVVLFYQLVLLILFIPANNQLLQTRHSFCAIIVLAIWWIYDHQSLFRFHAFSR